MTPQQFGEKLLENWGAWKEDEHKRLVWDFVRTKHGPYLDAMYKVLTEERPPGFGPPCLPDLMSRHERVCTQMERSAMNTRYHENQRQLPDDISGDKPLSQKESLALLYSKFADKVKRPLAEGDDPYTPRKTPLFPALAGVRGDEPISLSPDYYDEKMSMEKRMEDYCLRRAAIQKRKVKP